MECCALFVISAYERIRTWRENEEKFVAKMGKGTQMLSDYLLGVVSCIGIIVRCYLFVCT